MSSRVHLLDPEVRANPYPLDARLRREAPVSQVDPGGCGPSPVTRTCCMC